MNLYDAIMKAADHIEQNPQLFDYHNIYVPDCGTPACALGWIGHFAGIRDLYREDGLTNVGYVEKILGRHDFYAFMVTRTDARNWIKDAAACARGMRVFAKDFRRNFAQALMANLPTERIPDEAPSHV